MIINYTENDLEYINSFFLKINAISEEFVNFF